MFHFLIAPLLQWNVVLIAAAVIPAALLMLFTYRSDRLERESPRMLWNLFKAGVLSSLLAMVEEKVLSFLLDLTVSESSVLYNVILYFGIVAFAEESSKFFLMKAASWKSDEFDCQYDAVVYALFVSLGFALWENISYVLSYGFSTALIRAVTAIPGHACFGVFMGVFYGLARREENSGDPGRSQTYRFLAVLIPALLHGAYDYIASSGSGVGGFIAFIAVLFLVSFLLVRRMSRNDRYLDDRRDFYE